MSKVFGVRGLSKATEVAIAAAQAGGIRPAEFIDAAVAALMVHLARQGKLSELVKRAILAADQHGVGSHNVLANALVDDPAGGFPVHTERDQRKETDLLEQAVSEMKAPRRRGRPKKAA